MNTQSKNTVNKCLMCEGLVINRFSFMGGKVDYLEGK